MKEEIVLDGVGFINPSEPNRSVLVSKTSKLITVILLEAKQWLFSIDSEYLVRVWNLKNGKAINSYLLNKETTKKLTYAVIDKT